MDKQLDRDCRPDVTDIDENSFEMCDPPNPSLSDSISIVNIPDSLPYKRTNPLDSQSSDLTARVDSIDGLPNFEEVRAQDLSHKDFDVEKRNESLKELSETLSRIEDNCPKNGSNVLNSNLESYLKDLNFKEIRETNEVLLKKLENNNIAMKEMVKKYQELDAKHKQLIEDLKRVEEVSNNSCQQNQSLSEENLRLKDTVTELEAKLMESDKLKSELSNEVKVVRSRSQQMANYEKFNVSAELRTQEMISQLIDSQLKIDSMRAEINELKKELTEANQKLESLPALESQLQVYERDFKLEEMAKMAALKENEELENDIEKLKLRITELEEKLDRGDPTLELQTQDDPRTKYYTCPKCWCRFERYQAIQHHFQQCLDDNWLFA